MSEELTERLVESVVSDIVLAGLEAFRGAPGTGANVFLDYSRDESGEVFVEWYPSEELRRIRMQCALVGDFDHPMLGFMIAVQDSMMDALGAILEAAGYGVDRDDVGVHEFAFRITAGSRMGNRAGS